MQPTIYRYQILYTSFPTDSDIEYNREINICGKICTDIKLTVKLSTFNKPYLNFTASGALEFTNVI